LERRFEIWYKEGGRQAVRRSKVVSRSLISRIAGLTTALSLGVCASVLAGGEVPVHARVAVLAAPRLQATDPTPADRATGVATGLLLWVAGETAVQHVVYLGGSADRLAEVARLPASDCFFYPWMGLVAGTTTYWRVDEVDSGGNTIVGPVWSFTLLGLTAHSPVPQEGGLYQPLGLTLAWGAGATAAGHRLYLGTDPAVVAAAGITWPEFRASLQAAQTQYSVKGLVAGTTYYWRVDEVELTGKVHKGSLWRFKTIPQLEPRTDGLVAWWTFDEGAGQVAVDWSGHQHHGTLHGGLWVQGPAAGAVELNGLSDFIEAPGQGLPRGQEVFTMVAWIRPTRLAQVQTILGWGPETPNRANWLELHGSSLVHRFVDNDCQVEIGESTEEWIHVGVAHTGHGNRLFYLNGTVQEALYAGATAEPNVTTAAAGLGAILEPAPDRFFGGSMDEVRVYDRVLDSAELISLVRGDPCAAWNPRPGDRALVETASAETFAWAPGEGAVSHDVYFGADAAAVERATPSTPWFYQGRVSPTLFRPTETWTAGQTYFWRVDECLADGTICRGSLWRLTIAGHQVIDDFESYAQQTPHRLFETWWDGTGYTDPRPGVAGNGSGSTVGHAEPPYVEQAIIHGGRQSMPLYFDNGHAPYTSVVERRFSPVQDWMAGHWPTLRIHLWGDPSNRILKSDLAYVELEDASGHAASSSGSLGPQGLSQPAWTAWDTALSAFAGAGVDLRNIRALRIGIGQRSGPGGGRGVVYLDDIRLQPAIPLP
jgi:hypothetical protein